MVIRIWEYKGLRILKRIKFKSNIYSSYESRKPDEEHWFHIVSNNNNEVSGLSLVNVLNHFGEEGWELVSFSKEDNPFYEEERVYHCIILDLIYLGVYSGKSIVKILMEISDYTQNLSKSKIRKYVQNYPNSVKEIIGEIT